MTKNANKKGNAKSVSSSKGANAASTKGATGAKSVNASGTNTADNKKSLIIGLVVLAVVIVASTFAYNALAPEASTSNLREETTSSTQQEEEDVKAPDFTAVNAEGEEVSLSSFEGKPVVLNFWASTCGPCKSEMPGFQAAYEELGDQVNFVMVNIPGFNGETEDRAKAFLAENGYTFPVLFDTSGMAAQLYGISSIPQTFFLDEQGYVVIMSSGALPEESLQQGLDMIL